MQKQRCLVWLALAGMMSAGGGLALAQDYPEKTVRIVTTPAGGGNDFSARNIASGISGPLGQSVIVDNRPTRLVGEIVAKSPPDGYTLLLAGGSFALTPLLEKTRYDPVKDFTPITMVDTSPSILVVHPSLPVKSVRELVALAKSRPGVLNYPSGGVGSSNHLAAELFKSLADINIVHVPYRGSGPSLVALISGEVELMIPNVGAALPFLKIGKLRALAVGSAKPSPLVPGLPTIAASGVPGYDAVSLHVMMAPVGTPRPIIDRLNREIVHYLGQNDVKERLVRSGVEALGSTPEELATFIKEDMVKWGKVIRDAGIRAK